MSGTREPIESPAAGIAPDLVEYVVIGVADLASLSIVAPALVALVQRASIRILDVVVLVKDGDGAVEVLELDAVQTLQPLPHTAACVGHLLTGHDLDLVALAVQPGTAAVVVVTEDRWAEPLSAAARRAGGGIIAGERIPASQVESALAEPPARPTPVAVDDRDERSGTRLDLLVRPPCAGRGYEQRWAALFVDPTDQLRTLADLLADGLLSAGEFERQKAKVIDPWS